MSHRPHYTRAAQKAFLAAEGPSLPINHAAAAGPNKVAETRTLRRALSQGEPYLSYASIYKQYSAFSLFTSRT